MKKGMFGVVVLAVLMCFTGVKSANAQGKIDLFVGYSYLLDNFTSSEFCFSECFDPGRHGYNVSATWNFTPRVGLEANMTGNHGTSTLFSCSTCDSGSELDRQSSDTVTALFGPKLTYPLGMSNFSIFTHFLVGIMHQHESITEAETCSECSTGSADFNGTGFGMKVGGGLDWNHGRWGLRILELDYLQGDGNGRVRDSDFSSGEVANAHGVSHDLQMATGIKFTFGNSK